MRHLFTLALFVGITTLAFGQAWNQQSTSGDPEARSHATAVYDSLNHRMIVFGGRAATGFLNDLWSLDLNTNTWTEITVSGTAIPSPRWTHNATWDAPNQQLYIWTGQGQGNALFNDVWVFRFADNTWNELSPDGNATGIPTRRYGSGTVLNEANGLLVTFAGFTTSGRFDDTWTYDVATDQWVDRSNSIFPEKRCLFNAAHAVEREEMIIFGGQTTGNRNDIWSLDLNSYTWQDLTPATSPPARHFASLCYRPQDDAVILYGGNASAQGNYAGGLDDIWRFDLDTEIWSEVTATGTMPPARSGHTAVWVPSEGRMIVHGGRATNATYLGDTWSLDMNDPGPNSVAETAPLLDRMAIFPNPAGDAATLRFFLNKPVSGTLRLVDLLGKTVHSERVSFSASGSQQHQLDLQQLGAGVYTVILSTGSENHVQRFLRQ